MYRQVALLVQALGTTSTGRGRYWYRQGVLLVQTGGTTGTDRGHYWYRQGALLVQAGGATGTGRGHYWYRQGALLVQTGGATGTGRFGEELPPQTRHAPDTDGVIDSFLPFTSHVDSQLSGPGPLIPGQQALSGHSGQTGTAGTAGTAGRAGRCPPLAARRPPACPCL